MGSENHFEKDNEFQLDNGKTELAYRRRVALGAELRIVGSLTASEKKKTRFGMNFSRKLICP